MWVNLHAFLRSSRVNCVTQINFNLYAVDKVIKQSQLESKFYPG